MTRAPEIPAGEGRTPAAGGVRELLAIALPMLVSHGCETAMTFTDRMFLAKVAPELMNAAMAGGLTCFMMMTFFLGLTGYTTALVAQYVGAGRKGRCAAATTQAILIALAAWPLILLARPLVYRMFELFPVAAEQAGPRQAYFDIIVYAAGIGLVRHCLCGFFSGIGRTRMVSVRELFVAIDNM